MYKKIRPAFQFGVLLAGFVLGCETKITIDSPETIATVNGRSFSVRDYHLLLQRKYGNLAIKDSPQYARIKAETLKDLVRETAIVALAERHKIFVTDAEVLERIESLTQGQDPNQVSATLLNSDVELEDWKKNLRDNILREKTFGILGSKQNEPSVEELREFYEATREDWTRPDQVRLLHIVLSNFEEAESVRQEIAKNPARFEELARRSLGPEGKKGGLLVLEKGTMPESFEKALSSLRPNTLSPVVQTEYGFHIFKLLAREPARRLSFEEALSDLKRRWTVQNRELQYEEWLNEVLESAEIRYNRKLIEKI